jgi:hypothetical protein
MTDFEELLRDTPRLATALQSVQLTAKEKSDLCQLYDADERGIPVHRDKGQRARGDTVSSCSKVGAYLTRYFEGVGPSHKMMWIGRLCCDADGEEWWSMRSEMRAAIHALGWGT